MHNQHGDDMPTNDIPREKTFKLLVPVTFAEQTFTEIQLREPTAGEIEQIADSPRPGITAISVVGAVPIGAVEQLRARDYNAMRAYINFFLERDCPANPIIRLAELARFYGWSPEVLHKMTWRDLNRWYGAARIVISQST